MNTKLLSRAVAAVVLSAAAFVPAQAADLPNGKAVFDQNCAVCHVAGIAGAPRIGDAAAWAPRMKGGPQALYTAAIKGKAAMPARGGNPNLTDAQVQAAVNHIIGQSGDTKVAAKPADAAKPAAAAPASAKAAEPPKAAPAPVAAAPAPAAAALSTGQVGANTFNRLMKPPAQRNLPPPEDGIHDPANDGTHALQTPRSAFDPFARNNDGNRVDWVRTLNDGKINPRFDRNDPNARPLVMDLNIVREVKGSMPDVVYPHKQHTEWLDCSNCHPAIFVPQKGANQISMASILLGQQCGVCHGKVAFPVSDCRRCHSKAKPVAAAAPAKP